MPALLGTLGALWGRYFPYKFEWVVHGCGTRYKGILYYTIVSSRDLKHSDVYDVYNVYDILSTTKVLGSCLHVLLPVISVLMYK